MERKLYAPKPTEPTFTEYPFLVTESPLIAQFDKFRFE
jgi:hypothetical protein